MELIRGLRNLKSRHRPCVATIGNFDGIHRGHQAVFAQLQVQARRLGLPATVILFEPQPQEFFAPERAPARLTRLREKLLELDKLGIERVLCLRFDAAFAAMPAEDFIEKILLDGLGVRYLIVGDDFRFGKNRAGDYDTLRRAGQQAGFEVAGTPTFQLGGERVSSTRIREALGAGQMDAAARLLGRPYSLCGRVAHGDKRGRTLGFPTANIHLHRLQIPLTGVFAVQMHGVADYPWPGVANLGRRPTVRSTFPRPLLEVHLFDFAGNIYGRQVEIELMAQLREERRFPSLDELKTQIQLDSAQARSLLGVADAT